ncbi:MAG: hypothetical protein AAGM21_05420 [Pseudomonadota bacterium]
MTGLSGRADQKEPKMAGKAKIKSLKKDVKKRATQLKKAKKALKKAA